MSFNSWNQASTAGEKALYGDSNDTSFTNVSTRGNNVGTVGLLESTILPSVGIHSGLSIIAYRIGRATDRVEVKDCLWPAGQVANVFWSAMGSRMFHQGITLGKAWSTLGWNEKVLVTGMTLWGGRLFYRVVSRGVQRGEDDVRYKEIKQEKGFWNKALFSIFLPEALFQAMITLPFTVPFRAYPSETWHAPTEYIGFIHSAAVGLFSVGLAMETLADTQLDAHKKTNLSDLKRDGVWSIVRHPKYVSSRLCLASITNVNSYLGDALVHFSFPIMLYGSGLLHPLSLLGPLANYVFLRYVGGDKEVETSQRRRYSTSDPAKFAQFEQYSEDKNSFWPSTEEVKNPWLWAVVGGGVAGVVIEHVLREYV